MQILPVYFIYFIIHTPVVLKTPQDAIIHGLLQYLFDIWHPVLLGYSFRIHHFLPYILTSISAPFPYTLVHFYFTSFSSSLTEPGVCPAIRRRRTSSSRSWMSSHRRLQQQSFYSPFLSNVYLSYETSDCYTNNT